MNGIPFLRRQREEEAGVGSDPFIGYGLCRPIDEAAVGQLAGVELPDTFLNIRLLQGSFLFVRLLEGVQEEVGQCF